MRSFVRESYDLGGGRRFITHYTPSEFIFASIIKFLFFLFILWPLEILIQIILLPFRLIIAILKSAIPFLVKLVIVILAIIALVALFNYVDSLTNNAISGFISSQLTEST